MSELYAKDGKIYCTDYMEIYIPMSYFDKASPIAVNNGSSIDTFGVLYTRMYKDGKEGPLKLFNIPTVISLMLYEFRSDKIRIHDKSIDVVVLEYLKDACVLHQTVANGREVAESFLATMLGGKLPKTLNYTKIIDIWWKNMEIAGVSFKVPSKIFEMIIASIYRSPTNTKNRYGQYYGNQSSPNGYDYQTANVRSVVRDLSTFSGMVFEDIGTMITNGINNSIDGVEEPISPLEKIIHY